MDNKQVAALFNELSKLMELHGENPFKIRSYQNAYRTIRRMGDPVLEMEDEEIGALPGIGKAITAKIGEVREKGTFETLERYRDMTPEGIVELLRLKGFGPKKVKAVWDELGITSPGELRYACNENRLVELPGFGPKTQADLQKRLDFYFKTRDYFHYASVEPYLTELEDRLKKLDGITRVACTGAARRRSVTLEKLDFLISGDTAGLSSLEGLVLEKEGSGRWNGRFDDSIPVSITEVPGENFGWHLVHSTGPGDFVEDILSGEAAEISSEKGVFDRLNLYVIPPELRDHDRARSWCKTGKFPRLLEEGDIRGVVHAHSTYSDGIHSIEEMADAARERGYEYLVMSDHSRSAFYADGLDEDRVRQQWEEIDQLNRARTGFRIFKGIESDILSEGSLDYPDEILREFELVIASVHSNLKMDREKATRRLITAVENPYTKILGHPTGRLLLSRPGYPIDHQKVIDACASNGVSIELNANPYRLDLDWRYILDAVEKGVLISINPDAHSTEGIKDIHFGVLAARKGGLEKENCLNARGSDEFARLLGLNA